MSARSRHRASGRRDSGGKPLTPAVERPDNLADEAARLGLSVPDYLASLYAAARASAGQVQNGADLVAFWQRAGVVGSRPDIPDSGAFARELREQAEQRTD